VLLDLVNTGWANQVHARKALLNFLQQIHPLDRIAIFALGSRSLTRLHDYTTDSASLVERLQKASGEIPSDLGPWTVNPEMQSELKSLHLEVLADANQREADFFTAGRIVNTLATLQLIAQHLSGVPGRKNLIWLSGGFPLTIGFDAMPAVGSIRDRRTFTMDMDSAIRALNNSGVSVYPVDARGLMVMPGFTGASRSLPTGPEVVSTAMSAVNDNIDSMRALASRTGGRAAYNTNDLTNAVRRAIDDARVTYTLGYYSTDEIQDGRFREIKINVNRPHVDVRYRKGYFALRPTDDSPKTRQDEIRTAVWSPLESTAIGLNARVEIIDQPAPDTVNVILQIDPTAVSFAKDGDRWKTQLDVAYVQKDEHGRRLGEELTDTIALALTDASYTQAARDGVIRERRFRRDPEAVNVRIVVRDVANGAVGSLTIPFSRVAGPARY
jgi:VWFA-related protein